MPRIKVFFLSHAIGISIVAIILAVGEMSPYRPLVFSIVGLTSAVIYSGMKIGNAK